jgi:hypothetical protein
VELGYFAGYKLAAAYAKQIDSFPDDPTRNNPGDVALGLEGSTLGSMLEWGQITPARVGDWIRLNICNPTEAP